MKLADFLNLTPPFQTDAASMQSKGSHLGLKSKSHVSLHRTSSQKRAIRGSNSSPQLSARDKIMAKLQFRVESSMQDDPDCRIVSFHGEKQRFNGVVTTPWGSPPSSADSSDATVEELGLKSGEKRPSETKIKSKFASLESNNSTPGKENMSDEVFLARTKTKSAKLEEEVVDQELFATAQRQERKIRSVQASPSIIAPQAGQALTETKPQAPLAEFRVQREHIRNQQSISLRTVTVKKPIIVLVQEKSVVFNVLADTATLQVVKVEKAQQPPPLRRKAIPDYKRATILLRDLDFFLKEVETRYKNDKIGYFHCYVDATR